MKAQIKTQPLPTEAKREVRIILEEALKLIEKEENWLQAQYQNYEKTQFCLIGAISETATRLGFSTYMSYFVLGQQLKVRHSLYSSSDLIAFNDSQTHSKVIELLKSGIVSIDTFEIATLEVK